MGQIKILMVCLGNICRSPLAQGILESKVDPLKIKVDSAGTAAYHIGNPPDPRSVAVAKENGIQIGHQKARQLTREDFTTFSKIFVMDRANYNNVIALAKTQEEKDKVKFILAGKEEVPDPYYGDQNGFYHCYELLDSACEEISKNLA